MQGFTSELTNVTGTLQAKVDIKGAADDPHPNGAIAVQNGAFTVPSTGLALRVPAVTILKREHLRLPIFDTPSRFSYCGRDDEPPKNTVMHTTPGR